MMSTLVMVCLQIIFVVLILVGMVVVILGIGKLTTKDNADEDQQTSLLRSELENEENVISRHSLFRKFLFDSLRNSSK